MSQLPSTVQIEAFRSWFDDTRYARRAMLDDMMKDPIYDLIGEDKSSNTSDTLSTMGIDNLRMAKAKTPGGKVTKNAPVELDPHSVKFITFVDRSNYELESILHDQYKLLDPDGTSCVMNIWESVGQFLTNVLWNENDQTAFDVLAHEGVITYDVGCPDGKALIASDHSGPNYSGKTNIGGTGPLTGPNLVTNVDIGKANFTRGGGLPMGYRPDQIWIGDVEVMNEAARQITGSQKVSSSANNAVNIYADGSKEVVSFKYAPRNSITGSRSTTAADVYKWATAEKAKAKSSVRLKWIAKPQLIGEKNLNLDDENLDSFATAFCRLAVIIDNPFFMVQNNATTAPTPAW